MASVGIRRDGYTRGRLTDTERQAQAERIRKAREYQAWAESATLPPARPVLSGMDLQALSELMARADCTGCERRALYQRLRYGTSPHGIGNRMHVTPWQARVWIATGQDKLSVMLEAVHDVLLVAAARMRGCVDNKPVRQGAMGAVSNPLDLALWIAEHLSPDAETVALTESWLAWVLGREK